MSDLKKTQHYTTNYEKILAGLSDYLDLSASHLIEPFVGNGDLLAIAPDVQWEKYDLEGKVECIKQDTLLSPPDYTNKTVITNPPFLAKNHAADKTLFNKYGYDDLYKIFLDTIIGCKDGIVIVPGNFFCDESSQKIRNKFLSSYIVHRVNFFTYPVFESTSYSVCAFAFSRGDEDIQQVPFYINDEPPFVCELNKTYGYQVAGEELTAINQTSPVFTRLVSGRKATHPTSIYLYASDTTKDKIRLEWREEPYYGKNTDRMFASLDCKIELSEAQQKQIIEQVNHFLREFRDKYHNLPFTNYRDNNRKRVGFDFIYKLCSKIYSENF